MNGRSSLFGFLLFSAIAFTGICAWCLRADSLEHKNSVDLSGKDLVSQVVREILIQDLRIKAA